MCDVVCDYAQNDSHPLTADKGQIALSEKLPVPPISLFLILNTKLVYKKRPEYV